MHGQPHIKSYRFGVRTDNSTFVIHNLAPPYSQVCPKSSTVSLRLVTFGACNIRAVILTACPTDRRAVLLIPVNSRNFAVAGSRYRHYCVLGDHALIAASIAQRN